MQVHYPGDPIPNETVYAIYLMPMGPSATWQAEAVRLLSEHSFAGDVYVSESRPGSAINEAARAAWHESALNQADCVLIALSSSSPMSVRLDLWNCRHRAKVILIADQGSVPTNVPGVRMVATLEDACKEAAQERGELRRGGECQVPLDVWRTESFQAWQHAQKSAGNVLHGARVEWIFRIAPPTVLYWALRVDIEVREEGRRKSNEVVLGRPDVATVVLYRRGSDWRDTDVVLVREFRSPACTPDGFIWELPSGSSRRQGQEADAAVREVEEEAGLAIDAGRFRFHETRQLVGPLSVHKAHVFSVELSEAEMAALRSQEIANTTHGVAAETEVTAIRVRKLGDVFAAPFADWSTLGILAAVLR